MEPTESHVPTFDDPGLKAAVHRAWGGQRCPEALRAQVTAALHASRVTAPEQAAADQPATRLPLRPTTRPSFWQHPWLRYGLAAAATVLIGFGVAYRLDDTPFGRENFRGGTEVTFASTVPQPIAQGLVASHERCSKFEDHNGAEIPADDFPEMRRRLEERLRFPVLAGDVEEALGVNGWTFKGAAVCKVGDIEAAHLVFARDRQAISIFSLPPWSCRHVGRAHECEDPNADHPIAVFVWSDGVHCVVGSSKDRSLSVHHVKDVLERLRPTLPAPSPR